MVPGGVYLFGICILCVNINERIMNSGMTCFFVVMKVGRYIKWYTFTHNNRNLWQEFMHFFSCCFWSLSQEDAIFTSRELLQLYENNFNITLFCHCTVLSGLDNINLAISDSYINETHCF